MILQAFCSYDFLIASRWQLMQNDTNASKNMINNSKQFYSNLTIESLGLGKNNYLVYVLRGISFFFSNFLIAMNCCNASLIVAFGWKLIAFAKMCLKPFSKCSSKNRQTKNNRIKQFQSQINTSMQNQVALFLNAWF